ncbi:TPA: LexA family transcriptional regulator [Legionella pneumophila]|nr:LexA family transcriptional regulator [Legionella pneumophila]HBD7283633.1 LexA family transcriptional regulator [Legionella pneumophila]HEN8241152.1 LexA family transcriptional regulator [Legionella pneumophila]
MDIKSKIGLRIKESRKNKNFTAVQLAEITGFSAQRISNWERGTRTPKFEDAEIIASALGVSPTWLLFLDIENPVHKNTFKTIPILGTSSLTEGLLPVPTTIENNINDLSFSLVIKDDSMSPIYNEGDIVTFCREDRKNDLVLIKINASGENLFRKINADGNAFILSPFNRDWPQTRFESQSMFQIIGWVNNGIKVFY